MATDYVKRGKRPRKPVPRRKAPPPKNAFSNPKLLFALGLLLSGFVYVTYQYTKQGSSVNKENAAQQQKPVVQAKPKPDENALPPKPEEKWSYIETLENKKVQVETNQQDTPTRPYLMQCGAYRVESYAEERKAMIAFQGYESQVKITETQNGIWYRVVLGPYDLKRKAESDRNHLRRAGIEPCKIWHWEN